VEPNKTILVVLYFI